MVQARVTLGGVKPPSLLAERPCPDIAWGGNSTAAPRKKSYPGPEPFDPGRERPRRSVDDGATARRSGASAKAPDVFSPVIVQPGFEAERPARIGSDPAQALDRLIQLVRHGHDPTIDDPH